MNKISLITLFLFFAFSLKAQEHDLFSYMEEHLTSEETSAIDRAKSDFRKAEILQPRIEEEDKKNSKYFKNKQRKKAEKKSYEAKRLRIEQAMQYKKAYIAMYDTYLGKIKSCSFYYPEDKKKVNELMEHAKSKVAAAVNTIESYDKKSKKHLKKLVYYKKLKNDLMSSVEALDVGVNDLIKAYSVYVNQEEKKLAEQEENRIWQNAESDGTINSYQSYLKVYPNGTYSAEAKRRVKLLEEKMQEMKKQKIYGSLYFSVQIAASRIELPKWKIARIYRKTAEITIKHYDDWYKYSVGEFKTYEEAKEFLAEINVSGAFVVAYVDDKKIDIQTAIDNQVKE